MRTCIMIFTVALLGLGLSGCGVWRQRLDKR